MIRLHINIDHVVTIRNARGAYTLAHGLGLEVATGHGLTRSNVLDISAIPEVVELNIGHSVIADAGLIGMDRAVRDRRSAVDRGLSRRAAARI